MNRDVGDNDGIDNAPYNNIYSTADCSFFYTFCCLGAALLATSFFFFYAQLKCAFGKAPTACIISALHSPDNVKSCNPL